MTKKLSIVLIALLFGVENLMADIDNNPSLPNQSDPEERIENDLSSTRLLLERVNETMRMLTVAWETFQPTLIELNNLAPAQLDNVELLSSLQNAAQPENENQLDNQPVLNRINNNILIRITLETIRLVAIATFGPSFELRRIQLINDFVASGNTFLTGGNVFFVGSIQSERLLQSILTSLFDTNNQPNNIELPLNLQVNISDYVNQQIRQLSEMRMSLQQRLHALEYAF